MGNGISKETFEKMDADSKLNVLFDYVHEIYRKQRPIADKLMTLLGGAIGGFIATLGMKFIK
ncbi:MAG: hypothetical protein PHW03_05300 [Eubacteriales bacterium]|nr:hypothetical protein [Eubacteriales bacterium]